MAEVDTSIYKNQVQQPNLMNTLTGIVGIQNQMNQNKLFQQQFNTNRAVSDIYKNAIDPATGQLDPNKIRGLMASDPNVTYGLPQAIQNSQEAQQRNMQIEQSQIDLARKNLTTAESYLSPLLSHKAPSSGDIVGVLSEAMTKGHLDQKMALELYGSLPRDAQGQIDETKIRPWLQQQQMRVMDAKQRFDAMFPAPQMVNTGQQQIPVRLPQIGEPTQAGPGIQNQLPPSTPVFNPATNQPGYLGAQGGSGVQSGPGGGQGAGRGFIASGPALGVSEAAAVDAQASANQGIQLQSEADQVPAQKALLGNLEGALDKFTQGPGQDWKLVAKAFANANLPEGLQFDPKSIASQEEFNKQAVQLAQAQFRTLGGTGTDAKLDSAMHTSPNSALSRMGNKGIIAMLKGNADAISIKNREWQKFKQQNGPQSYGRFSTEFNQIYDPRVFQSQYLNTEDRTKMLKGMSKEEQKSFLNSYRKALDMGWVKLPSGK